MGRWSPIDAGCIAMYLGAIVIANVAVATWGQVALPFTAVCLIPFDLCTRDVLHERWHGDGRIALWSRMAVLIFAGSVLSAALSWQVARIALASFVAFAACGFVDAIAYQSVPWWMGRYVRMNVSNFFGAWADSLVFPLIAFTTISGGLVVAQAMSKFLGGVILSAVFVAVLRRMRSRALVEPQEAL